MPATVYRCKARKPNGEIVDGCGWQGEPAVTQGSALMCPTCGSTTLRLAVAIPLATAPYHATVELLPGVFVSADGSARGPGLEAALMAAQDLATLDAWAAQDPGQRAWLMVPAPAGAYECVLSDRRREPDGNDRTGYSVPQARATDDSIEGSWQKRFCDPNADDIPVSARRAAADAIRNGRLSSP